MKTIKQVAEQLGISIKTIEGWVRKGLLPSERDRSRANSPHLIAPEAAEQLALSKGIELKPEAPDCPDAPALLGQAKATATPDSKKAAREKPAPPASARQPEPRRTISRDRVVNTSRRVKNSMRCFEPQDLSKIRAWIDNRIGRLAEGGSCQQGEVSK
ncbi:hypothetical protein BH23VER1_BH23VER1_32690 [soil metagenome]